MFYLLQNGQVAVLECVSSRFDCISIVWLVQLVRNNAKELDGPRVRILVQSEKIYPASNVC